VPEGVADEAVAHPGGTVSEIDGSLVPNARGYVPTEAIKGVFLVGADGVATGVFLRNPNHGPVRDDFEQLTSGDHWLGWLPGEPAEVIRSSVEDMVRRQASDSRLDWLKVIDEPVFLTGAIPAPDDPTRALVRRAAMAVPFAMSVTSPTQGWWVHTGTFAWVAPHLDEPERRRDRRWLDLGFSRADVAEALQVRFYELDDDEP
jgi:hypothetical protein